MLRTLLAAAALVTALGIAPTAVSQAPRPGAAPAVPRYQVEVIIFAYRDFDPNEERFQSRPPRPITPQALRERPVFDDSSFEPLIPDPNVPLPSAVPAPEANPTAEPEVGFRLLRADELQLNSEYRRIGNVPTYLPLVHAGWVQPGLPEGQAESVNLATLGARNPMGSIRVHLSRYLHVSVDLSYQDTLHQRGGTQPAPGDGLRELELAPRYDLVDERTVTRSSDLHYFDHPAFGVLVKVTPVPAATPTSPAATGVRPAA